MTSTLLTIALGILGTAELCVLWRVLKGPTLLDRLTAAAMGATILTFMLALAGALKGSALYYEAALAAALLAVANTIILCKIIATGRIL